MEASVWGNLFQWHSLVYSSLVAFILDIAWVSIMVRMTGGSTVSAYSPIYFMLPPLAIFLRESQFHIIVYLFVVILSFSWNLSLKGWEYDHERSFPRLAYWVVSIISLLLTTFIGYITRPG